MIFRIRTLVLAFAFGAVAGAGQAAESTIDGRRFTLPDGFTVERVTNTNLVQRPVSASFDDQGRLYVTDSDGSNAPPSEQLKNPGARVVRLEDTDGDGVFDRSVVFADRVMFPQGCLWHDGWVYVAAPPSLWRFRDADGDGRAELREEWFKGGTLTGCANDIHGPYLGPQGYLYWTKGAFAEQTHTLGNGRTLNDRAAHILRARPDGSDLGVIMSGGMDNPVEVAFTPEGEALFTSTFIDFSQPGWRDGIGHAVYGGVFGKANNVLDDGRVKRTGPELLHPFVQFGPGAPTGLCRYEHDAFGAGYRDNFFATTFNLQKVSRHVLRLDRATYASTDSDFLASEDRDFHPTDVLPDADGSLLVVDTGGWYKLCCPSSQLAKADVLGSIYRVRRAGAHAFAKADRNYRRLTAPPELRFEHDLESHFTKAIWEAQTNAAHWLNEDIAAEMRKVSTNAHAAHALRLLATNAGLKRHRQSVPALLAAATHTDDAFLTHSLIFALIEIADAPATRLGLQQGNDRTHRAALIALDQMDGGNLVAADVVPSLNSSHASLREAALWIAGRHPDWGGALAGFFKDRLASAGAAGTGELPDQLALFGKAPEIQALLAATVTDPQAPRAARLAALQAMARTRSKDVPPAWTAALAGTLDDADPGLVRETLATVRALPLNDDNAPRVALAVTALAADRARPADLRVAALGALPGPVILGAAELFETVRAAAGPTQPVALRTAAAEVLGESRLEPVQLLALCDTVQSAGPLEVPRLLGAYTNSTDVAVGRRLLGALRDSKALPGLRPDVLRATFAGFPPEVRDEAEKLIATVDVDASKQRERLDALLAELQKLGGDVRRGQAIFNSATAACATCHKIGYLGGTLGPDLTTIGTVRNDRDLLEAIVYPSTSFVRSYEPVIVATRNGEETSGVVRHDGADEIVLGTGANAEVRLARADIREVRAGTVSVMPQGLEEQISRQQLADLLGFLRNTRWGPQ